MLMIKMVFAFNHSKWMQLMDQMLTISILKQCKGSNASKEGQESKLFNPLYFVTFPLLLLKQY